VTAYDDAVAGWYTHLHGGGTDTWARWLNADRSEPAVSAPRTTAVQLELVRRLGELGELPRFGALAEAVVATPAFGRGSLEMPLPWPEAPTYGPRAVPPEDLPAGELLRVAAPVLARLVPRLPEAPPRPAPAGGRWWRRAVTVTGPPALAGPLRRQLLAAGLRDRSRNATRIVLAAPFEQAMFGLWSVRVAEGASVRWSRFWQIRSRADRVPPAFNAARLARLAPGPHDRTHLVIAADRDLAARTVAELSGVAVDLPPSPEWAEVDLRRRLNRVVEATTDPPRRAALGARLAALLREHPECSSGSGGSGESVAPPRAERAWAVATGIRLADDVASLVATGGYPVHGNPADLLGAPDPGVDAPVTTTAERTLHLALVAVRAAWAQLEGGR